MSFNNTKTGNIKYELTDESMELDENKILFRIKALRDIPSQGVKAGDLGGWVQSYGNLSFAGNCWVFDNAKVYAGACVHGNATVCNTAVVCDSAEVCDRAHISGNAKVCDQASIFGECAICNDVKVSGSALVYERSVVSDDAQVYGYAQVYGDARVRDNSEIYETAHVYDYAIVGGDAQVYGTANIRQNALIRRSAKVEDSTVEGFALVTDDAYIHGLPGSVTISGTTYIGDNVEVVNQSDYLTLDTNNWSATFVKSYNKIFLRFAGERKSLTINDVNKLSLDSLISTIQGIVDDTTSIKY